MASETKQRLVLCFLLLATSCIQYCVQGESKVPCMYAFGDSLTDAGNNNFLPTISKSNYLPYGIDFKHGPTGRYTNNQTQFDILVKLLGFKKYIPPYRNISGSDIRKGVNYACGGAGILNETGYYFNQTIYFGKQVQNHKTIVDRIGSMNGSSPEEAKLYLKKCLYYINFGTNDYAVNYLLPNSTTRSRYTPQQFAQLLIDQYYRQLKRLYDLGARKFPLFGLYPLGCAPDFNSNGSCNGTVNGIVKNFNVKLKALVDKCNTDFTELPEAKCIYVNVTAKYPTPTNPHGFTNTTGPCCQVDPELGFCIRNSTPCQNRNQYVSYDNIHPTSATNERIAIPAYNGSDPTYTYPFDIHTLAQM